jgi:hypothetical protein
MKGWYAFVPLGMGMAFVMLLAACQQMGIGYEKIGEIQKDPAKFEGKVVSLKGTVTDIVKLPLVETKLYSLSDGTGQIIVLTKAQPPAKGSEVRVKGTATSVAILGGKAAGLHVEETERQ